MRDSRRAEPAAVLDVSATRTAGPVWRTPEELIELGFARSRVVMMNEAHDGLRRSVRTRRVGKQILPAAHAAGARYIAMEALMPEFAREANATRRLPEWPGYLAQPEMRELIAAALELGWTLVHYEYDYSLQPPELKDMSIEGTNWREDQQARNLVAALGALPADRRLLVWCGNSHLSKCTGDEWVPMGARFRALSGIEAFAIDQLRSIRWDDEDDPEPMYERELRELGGTAGFLLEDAPDGFGGHGEDAYILSTDNELS